MKINKNTNIMILYLFLIFGMTKAYAQIGVGDVVTSPVASPSMAAMSQYSDVSVSLATGLPDIGIPLLAAPIKDGGVNWPLSLSYNTRSIEDEAAASDVGNGWSFFGAGVIYKKIINTLDECNDNTTYTTYKKNEFDDLYYYDLPGLSGKFRIKRDTINNTFSLSNLTPNHAKIEYVRNSNTATFKADSFTITADNGYKYLFDKTDIAKYNCGDLIQGKEYKTAYYLTKILNPIGVEVAVMSYDERTKYKGTSTTNLIFLQNKIKTITSRSGQVAFNYVYDDTLEPKKTTDKAVSDPYSLQKISLKNPAGEELFSYIFNYTLVSKGTEPSNKLRILNSIFKNDKNGTLLEKNSFAYAFASGEGFLKRIVSPVGAVTEYNFEQGEVYFNYNDPSHRNANPSGQSRIQNIKYYKNSTDANAYRTVNYGYDSFDLPNSASGYFFDNERDSEDDFFTQYVLYKSVKVSENGKGSVRYSFKTPDDYPKQQNGGTALEPQYFWPYYNITKSGLLSKKETYDEQNMLLAAELYNYELDQYSNEDYNFNGMYKISSQPAYIKKSMVTNKAFFTGGGMLESGSESWVSPTNLKPYYNKSFADEDTSEEFLTYSAGQAEYSRLDTAYMTGIPVITEEKKNGKTITKSVTKYENLSLLVPTSVYSAGIDGENMRQVMKMDGYDDKGNMVQTTSIAGLPTSFIYGYDKTQVIAKVEGAAYETIKNNPFVIAAITASNNDNLNPTTESNLIMALDNLRKDSSMTDYQITAYAYDPLIGVTAMITPDGQREIYEYDTSGKLKTVKKMEKDASGNAVYKKTKEYKYNYKQ